MSCTPEPLQLFLQCRQQVLLVAAVTSGWAGPAESGLRAGCERKDEQVGMDGEVRHKAMLIRHKLCLPPFIYQPEM